MFLDLPLQYKSHPERKKLIESVLWRDVLHSGFAKVRDTNHYIYQPMSTTSAFLTLRQLFWTRYCFSKQLKKINKPKTQIKYFKYHTSVRIILLYCGWDAIALVGWEPCMDLTDCQSQVYFSWNEKCIMFVLDFTKIQQTAKLKNIKCGAGPMARRESRVLAAKAGDVNWIHGNFMLARENKLPQTVLGPPHGRHRLHSWVCTHNIYK